jgi:MscS family membrane protein
MPPANTPPTQALLYIASIALLISAGLTALVVILLAKFNPELKAYIRSRQYGRWIRVASFLFGAVALFHQMVNYHQLRGAVPEPFELSMKLLEVTLGGWLFAVIFSVIMESNASQVIGNHRARKILFPFARKIGVILIGFGTLFGILILLDVNIWGMIAGLGIGGIAVAFAAKDSVENIFGSATLLLDMPFVVGDWVKIGTTEGIVEEINLRSTRIRTFEDSLITLPNANFIRASVENLGQRRSRRLKTTMTFAPGTSEKKILHWCGQIKVAILNLEEAEADSVQVTLYEIKDTGPTVQIVARFNAETYARELAIRQSVFETAMKKAEEIGLRWHGEPVELTVPPVT